MLWYDGINIQWFPKGIEYTIADALRQSNSCEENRKIKNGEIPKELERNIIR